MDLVVNPLIFVQELHHKAFKLCVRVMTPQAHEGQPILGRILASQNVFFHAHSNCFAKQSSITTGLQHIVLQHFFSQHLDSQHDEGHLEHMNYNRKCEF